MSIQFPCVSMSWHLLVVMALAVIVKLLCRNVWIRNRPSLMHVLWVLVMLKLITPAMVGLPIYERIARSNWFQTTHSEVSGENPSDNGSFPDTGSEALVPTAEDAFFANTKSPRLPNLASSFTPAAFSTLRPSDLFNYLVYFIWISVAIAFLLRLSMQILGVHRLKQSLASDAMLQSTAERIGRRIGCTRVPDLRIIDATMSPSLTGCFHPIILVPKKLTVEFSQEQLEAVLAHELSHYRRGDHLTAVAGLAIRSLCWWNPIAWWVYHELRCSQELCCDAMVIGKAQVPKETYARSLWSVVKWLDQESVVQVRPSAAMVTDAPNRHFRERLLSLARSQRTKDLSARDWWLVIVTGLGLVCHPSYGAPRFSPNAFQYRSSEAIPPVFHVIASEWTEAPHDSKVFGDQRNYRPIARGQFWFGKMDKPILLAILESPSRKERTLWVDSNRDQAMQEGEFAIPTKDASTWSIRITSFPDATNSSKEVTRPPTFQTLHASTECQLLIQYQNEKFSIAQSGQLHGNFQLDDKMIVAAIEDRNCNGLWTDRDDRLYIDLDGDGKWNAFEERFSCQESPIIHGTRYTLGFQDDELDLVALEGTGQLQAKIHMQNPDATIESCQAVLASTAGVHVTVDSLEHSIEVPVGEYMVKQVRLRIRDERVWSMVFEANGPGSAQVKVTKSSQTTIELLGEVTLKAGIIAGSLQSHHYAPIIVQPMCTSVTGLYLARCSVGDTGADEDSLLTCTIMMADGSSRRIGSIETTSFACGMFCPIRFPKSEQTSGSASVNMQFDSGPLAGLLTATIDEKP